jgi:putative membrane protein
MSDAVLTPLSWLALLLPAVLYASGVRSMWRRRAATGAGIRRAEAGAFAAGWLVMLLAVMSPLDALAVKSFAAHMVQHELMVLLAAPLIVLGRPVTAMQWGVPRRWRPVAAGWLRASRIAAAVAALGTPAVAAALHGTVLWAWHAPPLVEWSMASHWAHHAQHAAFLGSALLFWSAVLARGDSPASPATGMAWLLATLLHTSMLGALLAFAPAPWYPHYVVAAPLAGLAPLADQQLAGLVMWVPGGLAYLVAALALLARLIRHVPPSVTTLPSAPR